MQPSHGVRTQRPAAAPAVHATVIIKDLRHGGVAVVGRRRHINLALHGYYKDYMPGKHTRAAIKELE